MKMRLRLLGPGGIKEDRGGWGVREETAKESVSGSKRGRGKSDNKLADEDEDEGGIMHKRGH